MMKSWIFSITCCLLIISLDISAQTGSGRMMQGRVFSFYDVNGEKLDKQNTEKDNYQVYLTEAGSDRRLVAIQENGKISYEKTVTRYFGDYNHVESEDMIIEFFHASDTMRIEIKKISSGYFSLDNIIFQKGNFKVDLLKIDKQYYRAYPDEKIKIKIEDWQLYLAEEEE